MIVTQIVISVAKQERLNIHITVLVMKHAMFAGQQECPTRAIHIATRVMQLAKIVMPLELWSTPMTTLVMQLAMCVWQQERRQTMSMTTLATQSATSVAKQGLRDILIQQTVMHHAMSADMREQRTLSINMTTHAIHPATSAVMLEKSNIYTPTTVMKVAMHVAQQEQ